MANGLAVLAGILSLLLSNTAKGQLQWQNCTNQFFKKPIKGFKVFVTTDSLTNKPFKAYYARINLKKIKFKIGTDTAQNRRLTPTQFYNKNQNPLLVVNGTFFNFERNANLNLVVNNGQILSKNFQTFKGRGKDTLVNTHVFPAAIVFNKKKQPNITWSFTQDDTTAIYGIEDTLAIKKIKDSANVLSYNQAQQYLSGALQPQNVATAIGGGPIIVQNGKTFIANDIEVKFTGKQKYDLHPRTAIGYDKKGRLYVLVVAGRNQNAAGASLLQLADIFKNLGCVEALNLDGGGSSCMLINGKETIKPSDATGQRPVPAVFLINKK
jgi:exopolysaccharide biosynthesis protein